MLIHAIGGLITPGIAVALSPFPVIAIVLVLGTARARSNGTMVTLGWMSGAIVLTTIVVLAVAGIDGAEDTASSSSTAIDLVRIAGGSVLIAFAARKWRNRPGRNDEVAWPAWIATLGTVSPGRSRVLGVAMSGANAENFALTTVAATSIVQEELDDGRTVAAVAIYVLIGSISVLPALIAHLVAPQRAARSLDSVKEFMVADNSVIMMVILLLIGADILGSGIAGLGN